MVIMFAASRGNDDCVWNTLSQPKGVPRSRLNLFEDLSGDFAGCVALKAGWVK